MTVTAGATQKPNNTASSTKKFFDFMARSSAQLGRTLGQPDVGNVVQSTTNETGVAIDLTTEFGASAFQTDTIYRIVFRSIATVAAERPRPASICASKPPVECPISAGFLSKALMISVVWSATCFKLFLARTSGSARAP